MLWGLDIVFLLNIIHTFCKYGKEGHVTVPKLNKSFPFWMLFVLTLREKMLWRNNWNSMKIGKNKIPK